MKQIAETAQQEDLNHFEALLPRIYGLGSELPNDLPEFHDMSGCPPAKLPNDRRTWTPSYMRKWSTKPGA